MLRSKADVRASSCFSWYHPSASWPGEQGSALNQIEGKSRRPASTRFRAAPLP